MNILTIISLILIAVGLTGSYCCYLESKQIDFQLLFLDIATQLVTEVKAKIIEYPEELTGKKAVAEIAMISNNASKIGKKAYKLYKLTSLDDTISNVFVDVGKFFKHIKYQPQLRLDAELVEEINMNFPEYFVKNLKEVLSL